MNGEVCWFVRMKCMFPWLWGNVVYWNGGKCRCCMFFIGVGVNVGRGCALTI